MTPAMARRNERSAPPIPALEGQTPTGEPGAIAKAHDHYILS